MSETSETARATLSDIAALAILWVAKAARRRRFLRPRDPRAFYEGFFLDKDLELSRRDPRTRLRLTTLKHALVRANSGGMRLILDLGCGLGEVHDGVRSVSGAVLVGTDLSVATLRSAKSVSNSGGHFVAATADLLPVQDRACDLVLCLEVLEHLEHPRAALREIARILAPGGRLLVAVPYTYYWASYRRLMGHYRHYSRGAIVRELERFGFEIEEYLPNYPQWHERMTWCYVLASCLAATLGRGVSPYAYRLPFAKRPLMTRCEGWLQSIQAAEARHDYSRLSTSTFVMARLNA